MNFRTKLRTAVLLFLTLGSASAQGPAILGLHNADFARGLLDAGYPDLAEGLCKAVAASPNLSTEEKQAVEQVGAAVKLRISTQEADPGKRKEIVLEVVRAAEKTIEAAPDSANANTARDELPELYRQLAETYAGAAAAEADAQAAAALRKEGAAALAEGKTRLEARLAALADKKESDQNADLQYMVAMFDQSRLLYVTSLIYPVDSVERKRSLEAALTKFQEFDLEYGDRLLSYNGHILQALCLRDLGRADEGLGELDEAIKLRENFKRTAKKPFEMPSEACDIVSAAVVQKVLFLTELKKYPEAIAAADDFFESTPNPLRAAQGHAVMAAKAEAQLAAGDTTAASTTAQALAKDDPAGPWGATGREILAKILKAGGGSGSVGIPALLQVMLQKANMGDESAALSVGAQVLALARGTPEEEKACSEVYLTIGTIYVKRSESDPSPGGSWLNEAAAAFDAVHTKYPKSPNAADALWRAISCYVKLNGQEKVPYYKKTVDRLLSRLASDYPDSAHASDAKLMDAMQMETEEHYQQAAKAYEQLTLEGHLWLEAHYRAGNCHVKAARLLLKTGKAAEAKTEFEQGEVMLKSVLERFTATLASATEEPARNRIQLIAGNAKMALAALYLSPEVKKPQEVQALLKDIEKVIPPQDTDALAQVWNLRIRALQDAGNLTEAASMLDDVLQSKASLRRLAPVIGSLAAALDRQAAAQKKAGKPDNLMLRRSLKYYVLSLEPQLSGEVPLKAEDALAIADRLFTLGLDVNEVPATSHSFTDLASSAVRDPEPWEQASRVYSALATANPSLKPLLGLARVSGYLHKWVDADAAFSRLFEIESITDPKTSLLDRSKVAKKPELMVPFFEWGSVRHEVGVSRSDNDLLLRASTIFDGVVDVATEDSELWWQALYLQARTLYDRGLYDKADIAVRRIERTHEDFDGERFHIKSRFVLLKGELSKKVFK